MDLTTSIGNHDLCYPIYNASGVHCVSYKELDDLEKTEYCGAVLTKSSTVNSRIGNDHPRYYTKGSFSLNSRYLFEVSGREFNLFWNDFLIGVTFSACSIRP